MYSLIAKVIGAALLFAAMCWGIHLGFEVLRQEGRDEEIQKYTARDNQTLKDQLAEIARLNSKVKGAEDEAKRQLEKNRVLAVRNAELRGSMRDTDAAINAAIGHATAAALADATRAFVTLFGTCRGEYEAMGQAAAGHLVDVKKLSAAWPN